jgi:cobalt-zinc-cadmium efflux system protein
MSHTGVALGFFWWTEHYTQRGVSQHFPYGHQRFLLSGVLANAGVLVGGSLFVLSEAVPRSWYHDLRSLQVHTCLKPI